MGPIEDPYWEHNGAIKNVDRPLVTARSVFEFSRLVCPPKTGDLSGQMRAAQMEPSGAFEQQSTFDWAATPSIDTIQVDPSVTSDRCEQEDIDLISFDDVQMEPPGTSDLDASQSINTIQGDPSGTSDWCEQEDIDLISFDDVQMEPPGTSDRDASQSVNTVQGEPSGTSEWCALEDIDLISFDDTQMEPTGMSEPWCLMDWEGTHLVHTAREEPSGTLEQCKQEELDLISFDDAQMEPPGTSRSSVNSMELGKKRNVPMGPLSAPDLQGCMFESKLTSDVCSSPGAIVVQWEPSRTTELREGSAVKTQEGAVAQEQTPGSAVLVNSGISPNTRVVPLETISICQTKSLAVFKLDVDMEGHRVQAVVDTAAEVTLISDRLFHTLNPLPPFIRPCKIATAGRELSMDGSVVGPVRLKIGDRECTENIYVAPLEDEMLLGFDLLTKYGAKIDMGRKTITFGEGPVDFLWSGESPKTKVSMIETVKVGAISTEIRPGTVIQSGRLPVREIEALPPGGRISGRDPMADEGQSGRLPGREIEALPPGGRISGRDPMADDGQSGRLPGREIEALPPGGHISGRDSMADDCLSFPAPEALSGINAPLQGKPYSGEESIEASAVVSADEPADGGRRSNFLWFPILLVSFLLTIPSLFFAVLPAEKRRTTLSFLFILLYSFLWRELDITNPVCRAATLMSRQQDRTADLYAATLRVQKDFKLNDRNSSVRMINWRELPHTGRPPDFHCKIFKC